ncbi:unnamed protein product [Macrosiphum euphorbiae]|uniref:Uncharacterized protein n=1 Tax=Macrosiphum euphorbiae TaxID=13131 RepID=A0AAV0WZT7_9HEMI|nr:unnamed protein product [Macrosiphum euphorbiae]
MGYRPQPSYTQAQWLLVLAIITPPDLQRRECIKCILNFITNNQHLPLFKNIMNHPSKRLESRLPIWKIGNQSNSSSEIGEMKSIRGTS